MPAAGRVLGISDYLIASIFSLSALMWAITSPLWAARSDRKGRKQHILIGVGGFIVSMLGCGMVAQVFGKQTLKLAHGLLALELRLVLRKSLDIKAVD